MLKAIQYIQKYHMIEKNDCIIVGVSGGADSVCLLFVLHKLQERLSFTMVVVHVEHGIRKEASMEDADYVRGLCETLSVPFVLYRHDVNERAVREKISVEEAGRNARYESFEDAMNKYGGTKIAVAHNQNDQAETILWNLVRGSGIRGLGGTKPVRGKIIRPLLAVTREEIEAYLEGIKIEFRTDETNLSDDYTRNKLRHHVIPYLEEELNHNAVSHIAGAGGHLQKVEAYLEEMAEKALEECKCKNSQKNAGREVSIFVENVLCQPEVIQEYLLRRCLILAGVGLKDIGSVHIEAIQKLLREQSGRSIHLPGGFRAVRSQDYLYFEKMVSRKDVVQSDVRGIQKNSKVFEESLDISEIPGNYSYRGKRILFSFEVFKNQNIEEKKYTKWLDYDKISSMICLRSRQSGDYFTMNHDENKKKLKSFFIDEKIPREKRDEILLVTEGAHVLWIVGYRISQAYKVTEKTRRLLKIQVMEDECDER